MVADPFDGQSLISQSSIHAALHFQRVRLSKAEDYSAIQHNNRFGATAEGLLPSR